MKVFVLALGSGGDFYPLLASAIGLARRGHAVTVLAGDWHEPSVRAAGLDFHAVLDSAEFARIGPMALELATPGGTWVAFFHHGVMPTIAPVYDYVAERLELGNTLLVGPVQGLGLRLIEERFGVPLVTLLLQPRVRDWDQTDDAATQRFDAMYGPLVNRYRRRYGLPPLGRSFKGWMVDSSRMIGLFPEWFLSRDVDLPNQGRLADFVLFDPAPASVTPPRLDAFLARHDAPLVFTYGTANRAVAEFFAAAAQASAEQGRAAIFLTPHRQLLPDPLPPNVLQLDYVPLAILLPYSGCLIHHGGIGTCAQALRAGIAQVIVPGAFDQYSNAVRAEALGVGRAVPPQQLTSASLGAALRAVLDDADVTARCREVATRFPADDGLERCCEAILASL